MGRTSWVELEATFIPRAALLGSSALLSYGFIWPQRFFHISGVDRCAKMAKFRLQRLAIFTDPSEIFVLLKFLGENISSKEFYSKLLKINNI